MKYIISIIFICLLGAPVLAESIIDTDKDGVSDYDEINIYRTDYLVADTDKDGYNDRDELKEGYSPLDSDPLKLEKSDFDNDGLSDRMELNFHTNLNNSDTDGDGYKDGEEVNNFYSPIDPLLIKLKKRIEINTGSQKLSYFLGGVRMGDFLVSSGVNNSTPKGHFLISNKSPKAWSPYGLWMPFWMGLGSGRVGIHELPIWPNGYREGENHLGKPVSHGCIRLGIGSAEFLYNWADVGTPVTVY